MVQLKRIRLSEQVANELEREIASGRLRPGDVLPSERELMQQFGVGRPSVREALFSLQKAGLVEVQNGARARVIEPNHGAILSALSGVARLRLRSPLGQQHFHELRLIFETGLVRLAVEEATSDDIGRLEEALARNKEALGDLEQFKRTDIQFHYTLAEITKNPLLPAIHTAMVDWLMDQREVTLRLPGQAETAYDFHERIFRAVAARDAESAHAVMAEHLRQTFGVYSSTISKGQTKARRRNAGDRPPAGRRG